MGAERFAVEERGPGQPMRKRLAGFVVTLRDAGFVIGQAEAQDAARLITSPMAERPERLRAAMRTLFASRRTEIALFDELFDAFWRGRGVKRAVRIDADAVSARSPKRFQHGPNANEQWQDPTQIGGASASEGASADGGGRLGGASTRDAMSKKDIAAFVGERERARAGELAERFARVMRTRLTRRERARRRGRRLDLRATIRLSVAHGGEPLDLKFRRRKIKPLRLVALLDASGSMESYVAFFTRFLHAVTQVFRESEAFLFHTRLAHVSSALKERDPARALDRLALMAAGVGGGTKIGECLAAFNRTHAKRVIHSRTCVMILSDGYDTGPPDLLASAMRDLRRRCKRIVWLNPLTGRGGFEPSARGMQAALPYLDLFAPAHSLESLAALEPYLARI
ncbi:MAG: VWA domain-containing protein [Hyphomicrobiales bacterium]|nr:VWA domain-containing protein [Hyphomicrobiales bacterium]